DEEIPFDVNEPIDVEDVSDQEGGVMENASRVPFVIQKASIRIQLENNDKPQGPTNKWKTKKLLLQVAIGAAGIDGGGKYAKKNLFPEMVLTFNKKEFPKDFDKPWWHREARFPLKQFLKAIGAPLTGLQVNDEWLEELKGREFAADVKRVPV